MDKKTKNSIIISITAVALVLAGVTYAYFSARITGLESASTISLTAGRMGIQYSEGDGVVTITNIYPRAEAWFTKTIALTGWNTTDLAMNYELGINVTTNTFTRNYITYDLTLISGSVGSPIATITGGKINGTGHIRFGYGQFTQADGDQHIYELKIYFKDNGQDQNDSQNAVLNGKIYVTDAGTGALPTGRYYYTSTYSNEEFYITSNTLLTDEINNIGVALMTENEEIFNQLTTNESFATNNEGELPSVCAIFDNGEACFRLDGTLEEFQSTCTNVGGNYSFSYTNNNTEFEYYCNKNNGPASCQLSPDNILDCYNETENIQCVVRPFQASYISTCGCFDC